MGSLIFDKLKVKISFPNQTLVDCSAAMKITIVNREHLKFFLEHFLVTKELGVFVLTITFSI